MISLNFRVECLTSTTYLRAKISKESLYIWFLIPMNEKRKYFYHLVIFIFLIFASTFHVLIWIKIGLSLTNWCIFLSKEVVCHISCFLSIHNKNLEHVFSYPFIWPIFSFAQELMHLANEDSSRYNHVADVSWMQW
jgi:ABC-type multidrug transport system permease subunit